VAALLRAVGATDARNYGSGGTLHQPFTNPSSAAVAQDFSARSAGLGAPCPIAPACARRAACLFRTPRSKKPGTRPGSVVELSASLKRLSCGGSNRARLGQD
jgi:hypothetical protein